jgi:hypothetical protein
MKKVSFWTACEMAVYLAQMSRQLHNPALDVQLNFSRSRITGRGGRSGQSHTYKMRNPVWAW